MKKVIQEILDDWYKAIQTKKDYRNDLGNKIKFLREHKFLEEERIVSIKFDAIIDYVYDMEKVYKSIQDVLNKS